MGASAMSQPLFTWKILEISAADELITHAKYRVAAQDGELVVETEGNWWFSDKILKKPFPEVTEDDVISWIEKETTQSGVNIIKSRLVEQLATLQSQKKVVAPWLPQVFTPEI
jgi:hypothetical protein